MEIARSVRQSHRLWTKKRGMPPHRFVPFLPRKEPIKKRPETLILLHPFQLSVILHQNLLRAAKNLFQHQHLYLRAVRQLGCNLF